MAAIDSNTFKELARQGRMQAPMPATDQLKFKSRRSGPLQRLPFVDRVPNQAGVSFWAVPKAGGYLGGNITGGALAKIYLKHLREYRRSPVGTLQCMVFDMFGWENWKPFSSPEQDAFCGQVVSFFCELERWLDVAARDLGGELDCIDAKDLLEQANDGLNFDKGANCDYAR